MKPIKHQEQDFKTGDVIRKFKIKRDYLSCLYCACNYGQNDSPVWCQIMSHPVNPRNKNENEMRAWSCDFWLPHGINIRSGVHAIEKKPERWYEKDSMA